MGRKKKRGAVTREGQMGRKSGNKRGGRKGEWQ